MKQIEYEFDNMKAFDFVSKISLYAFDCQSDRMRIEHGKIRYTTEPLFVYFCLLYMKQIEYKFIKALMVCLGLKPVGAGRKA